MLRQAIDKIMQGAIRLVMLTGVAFTVTACYGLPPEERYYDRYPEGPQTQQPAEQESLNMSCLHRISQPNKAK